MNISDATNNVMQVTRIDVPRTPGVQASEDVEAAKAAVVEQAQQAEAEKSEAVAPTEEEVTEVVNRMNDFVQSIQRDLSFSVDDETGHEIVQVIDTETSKIVRQIPSEEFLQISKSISSLNGILFEDQV